MLSTPDDRFRRGDPITAEYLNRLLDELARVSRMTADAPIGLAVTPGGVHLYLDVQTLGQMLTTPATPASLGSSQNDFDAGEPGNWWLLSSSTSVNITGIAARPPGTVLTLSNNGSNPITLTNLDGSSAAANQIKLPTGTDLTLLPCQSVQLIYGKGASNNNWAVSTTGGWTPTAVSRPAQITGTQTAYDPGTASLLNLSTNASQQIEGIKPGADGQKITVVNSGSNPLVLVNQSPSATTGGALAIASGGDLTLNDGDSATLQYDATDGQWDVTGSTNPCGSVSPAASLTVGEASLAADYSVTASFADSGLSVTLPTSGKKYRLTCQLTGHTNCSGAANLRIRAKLFDATAGSDVPDALTTFCQAQVVGQDVFDSGKIEVDYTTSNTNTVVKLYAETVATGSVTTAKLTGNSTDGYCTLSYLQLN